MKRHDAKTNETLSKIAARYMERQRLIASGKTEIVRSCAEKMCAVNIWELWVITQG